MVWENYMLTENTNIRVYQTSVLDTRLYGCEAWTTCTKQDKRLNIFHLPSLMRKLEITWQEHTSNKDVLERTNIRSMFGLLSQRYMLWLCQVCRMKDGHIPKDVLYDELAAGARGVGHPALRFRDACKRVIKSAQNKID